MGVLREQLLRKRLNQRGSGKCGFYLCQVSVKQTVSETNATVGKSYTWRARRSEGELRQMTTFIFMTECNAFGEL